MRAMISAYKIVVVKPKGKRPLVRPWHRWKVNTKMNLKEIKM
jgi:hypothetical protein